MKKMKNYLGLGILMTLLSVSSMAQVSFTGDGSVLNNFPGFSWSDCVLDMNGDHLDDVVRVGNAGLYIDFQQADGSFSQTHFPMNFTNYPSWSIAGGDIDGNGYNDLLFGDGNAVSFIYANEDGTAYEEVAVPDYIFSQRSTMADIDNDGNLDAFVCHDVDQSHPYRNDGMGNLTEDQDLIETLDLPGNYAAIWVDYDNDSDIDLYITKCQGGAPVGSINRTNRLYQNNGDGTFSEVGEAANMDDNSQSWATVFEDFDNDGDFDAFIVNHDFHNRFMLNNGDGTFTEMIDDTNIDKFDLGAWENASGDFNNDGFVDIFSELNDEIYLNNGDLTFTGINAPISSGGIGDMNNDGFLDIVRGNTVYYNDGNDNNWIKINTVGLLSNVNGIGARVEIHGDWGIQIREVRSGQSFSPMSSMAIHFGIGQSTSINQLIIKWPSGMVTAIDNPEINTTHTVLESDCILPPSEITVSGSTQLCPGGTVELEAPEGYTYSWSNGANTQTITVTESGSYSVVLTDSDNCISLADPVVITDYVPTIPTIDVSGNTLFCEGESVVLTSSEGSGYTWSNGMNSQSITVTESGDYSVTVDPVCPGDELESETITVNVLAAPTPVVNDVFINPGNTATINATGIDLQWYEFPTGGSPIATGPSFTTPVLDNDATYYVESHPTYDGELQDGGRPDFTGAGGIPTSPGYSLFDAWEPFTLLSVVVFVPTNASAGERTIQLFDENDLIMEELTFDLGNGQHVLDLNWSIPAGSNYSLRNAEGNLFRNSGGVDYPYAIGDVGEITTSTFGEDFYYYFYDWKIQKASLECVSERVEANVIVSGLVELKDAGSLNIFPNPAHQQLFVEFDTKVLESGKIQLNDALGKNILVQEIAPNTLGKHTYELNISQLASGIYFLDFTIGNETATYKIVVE